MAFFASGQGQIAAVNQMLQLPSHGNSTSHVDPADAATATWVKSVAGARNGSGSEGSHAANVWTYYQQCYKQH